MRMLAEEVLPTCSMLKKIWSPGIPGSFRQREDHVLVGLVRHHQIDSVDQRPAGSVRIRQLRQLAHHLLQIAGDQRLHLRPVNRDVVVELRVRPDDRVHFRPGAAGIGLENLDVRRRPFGRRAR